MNKALFAAFLVISSAAWAAGRSGSTASGTQPSPLMATKSLFRWGFRATAPASRVGFSTATRKRFRTAASIENGALVLNFDSYAAVLKATVTAGKLEGIYSSRGKDNAINATPAVPHAASNAKAPDISGQWFLENVSSSKGGEKAWRLIVRQKGSDVSGAILRVDGDTGTLTGSYKDGKFVLSHFSGARAALVTITPQSDGTLTVELSGQHHEGVISAVRPEEARAKGLPEPTDPDAHTGVKDASQPFPFSFPDLNGKDRFRIPTPGLKTRSS